MIVSNSSPLMYLAKIGKLDILKSLFKEIIIPNQVYEEIIRGEEEKYFDVLIIERAVEEGWIKVKKVEIEEKIEKLASEIDYGEVAVISLAKKLKPFLVLIDDASARVIAESFGFNVKGTLYVLLKACKNKLINKKELKDLINRLVFLGFRISQELYIQVFERMERL